MELSTPEVSTRTHVALVGLSGTGKSEVAPLLAARLGLRTVDLDDLVVARAGVSVAELFERDGEDAFRALESRELREQLDGPPAVLATGGGVVLDGSNRRLLVERCRVVWLRTPVDVLVDRLERDAEQRPLLQGDAATTLRRLAAEREALYAEVAGVVVATEDLGPDAVTDAVVEELERV